MKYRGVNHSLFTGEIDVRVLWRQQALAGEDVQYQLLAPFTFESRLGKVTAQTGDIIDFASIPKLAQGCAGSEHPAVVVSSVIHDPGYEFRGWGRFTRKEVDAIMSEAMEAVGSTELHRRLIHNVVRLGGGKAWRT